VTLGAEGSYYFQFEDGRSQWSGNMNDYLQGFVTVWAHQE